MYRSAAHVRTRTKGSTSSNEDRSGPESPDVDRKQKSGLADRGIVTKRTAPAVVTPPPKVKLTSDTYSDWLLRKKFQWRSERRERRQKRCETNSSISPLPPRSHEQLIKSGKRRRAAIKNMQGYLQDAAQSNFARGMERHRNSRNTFVIRSISSLGYAPGKRLPSAYSCYGATSCLCE